MKQVTWQFLLPTWLLCAAPALAGAPPEPAQAGPSPKPCQERGPKRSVWPNGSMLHGTATKVASDERSSILASVGLDRALLDGTEFQGLRLERGRLTAPPPASRDLKGVFLTGADSDGQPVKVAICGASAAPEDPAMVWYQLEIWHEPSGSWRNPCIATLQNPSPRALAVRGVWDKTGASREVAGRFTFACETGAISKCITWGYKPWEKKDGRSLQELHQACTRMARADYCGDGFSHTREDLTIDVSDDLGINLKSQGDGTAWALEAVWAPDGASCVARTRDGQAARAVLDRCPERFQAGEQQLADGEHCKVLRKGKGSSQPKLVNRLQASGLGTLP